MEKVLLAVDAEGSAEKAIQEVIQEAKKGTQMELHLMNVQEPPATVVEAMAYDHNAASIIDQGLRALAPACKALDQAGIPFTTHVATGDVAEAIVDYAVAGKMNRVVLGRHNRGFIAGLLHGSVAARVTRKTAIPLQIIPVTAVLEKAR